MKVIFVYPNSRTGLVERVARGEAPDTSLLGQNHLAAFGIDATIHNPSLRRVDRRSGLLHRITWNLREVGLPWELGKDELTCTSLARIFPLMARLRGGPQVLLISYHLCSTYERSSAPARRLLRASLGSAAAIVCISEAGRTRLIELTGVDPARVRLAQLGVDERYWQAQVPAPDGYVLSVGRDLARDYATFARAVADIPRRTVVVAKHENLRGIELPANVDVRLDISPAEVRDLYGGAACVVVPIHAEGHRYGTENSGTVALLEAMATARPVIVTERSTLDDYVRPGDTAVTVPAEKPEALRDAITRVLENAGEASRMGASARRAVEERFTTAAFAGRLADVIGSL
ncbi:MAG TPA: glycosyltransferase family 4 protein [Gaiellaceae bacterium]|nr:glycosyltransferase family 4 protein [Gaiellaceae bacterium]